MSYTLIGCGDFYNQSREKVWCPWTQTESEHFTIHAVKDANAQADWTHLDDFAAFLVASLKEPVKSHNAHLNFVSDTKSATEISELLEKISGKRSGVKVFPEELMHTIVANSNKAPDHLQKGSAFPVDFWFLVKGAQGQGRFRRPPGMIHNDLFPQVKPTTFDTYLNEIHGKSRESNDAK